MLNPYITFRSRVPHAEDLKKELAHLKELNWPDFKITNGPRTTRGGRVLRVTRLNEFPPLIKILKGVLAL